jgi:hypothetical protein
LGHRSFSLIVWFFATISIQLGFLLIFDLVFTPIVFIFSGNFESLLQQGLEEWIAYSSGFFASDTWKINTGLKGLDLMVNWFIKLQYDVLDRLVMFTLCCVVVIVSFVAGEFFGFSFIDKSSNPKTPNDIPIQGVVGIVAAYALIFPIILSFFGVLILVLK